MTDETKTKTPGLTLGSLTDALNRLLQAGAPRELEVTVRFVDGDGQVGGVLGQPAIEHAHDEDDTPFVALDCASEEETFEDYAEGGLDGYR